MHKYKLDENVRFRTGKWGRTEQFGLYRIVGLLPSEDGQNQYRIRNMTDKEERVAREVELIPSAGATESTGS